MGTRANDLASLITDGNTIDSSGIGTGAITNTKYGGVLSVDGSGNVGIGTTSPTTELEVVGTITDDVGDVRISRHTELTGSSDHNLTNEGVYIINAASTFSQIIIGTGANLPAGTVMTIYNNKSTGVTISRGSLGVMRVAADGNYTSYDTRTLGRNSLTTVTITGNGDLIILTGTSIS